MALVAFGAVATVAGVIALWPASSGHDSANSAATEIGLVVERSGASVTDVLDVPCSYSTDENPQQYRIVVVEVEEGADSGRSVELPEFNPTLDRAAPDLTVSDEIIVGYESSSDFYYYADRDRRTSLALLAVIFGVIVVGFGRLRGLLALVAMASTLLVLVSFVGPSVLDGNDPVLVSIVAAAAIAFVSLYLTHGVTPTTTIALAGTLAALALTLALSWIFFEIANFTGFTTDEALILPFISENINVSGLLLGGAILGALGALDDVTVTQVATVAELRRHNPTLSKSELTASGIRVGREHIASTVNTLLLAYAGASMPLLLLFAVSDQPLGMIANSELIAVEIVRTLCGSIGLIAAVPITTALAAAVLHPADEEFAEAGNHQRRRLLRQRTTRAEPKPQAERSVSEPVQPRRQARWEDFGPEESGE